MITSVAVLLCRDAPVGLLSNKTVATLLLQEKHQRHASIKHIGHGNRAEAR